LRLVLPIGLLLFFGSFVLKHFGLIPDFVNGLMLGLGIGMIAGSLIKKWYIKKVE
jgi:F0F1-type ATP synthase assembly protein I